MNPGLTILLVVIVLGGLIFAMRRLARGGGLDERLTAYAALPETERRGSGGSSRSRMRLVRFRLWMNRNLAFLSSDELTLQLYSASWPITVTEYILIRFGATAFLFLLFWGFTQNILVGIGVGLVVYITPGIFLRSSINSRRKKFEKQLVDVLVLITGAVKAGFSLLQAMEVVAQEVTPPASEEFRRVLQEVGLGRSMGSALENMARRMENQDLNLLVTAINIQYKVGGNLTTMLSAVTETIRERIRLFSELRALTSQQRFSSYILSLLPVIVAAILFIINPEYMSRLFNRAYWYIPAAAILGIVMGAVVIQRLVKMDF